MTIATLRGRRRSPPSALYTFSRASCAGLGSALPRAFHPGGSPTLTGSGRAFPSLPLKLYSKSVASTNFATRARHQCSRLGACLSKFRGRERGRFPFSRGGADVVGLPPHEEATTTSEGKSARSRRVGKGSGVCGVAWLAHSHRYGPRRARRARRQTHLAAGAAAGVW